jgi:hypothetical protein
LTGEITKHDNFLSESNKNQSDSHMNVSEISYSRQS